MLKTLMDCFVTYKPDFVIYVGGSLKETVNINNYSAKLRDELGRLFVNNFDRASFRVYDEWTNCGATVDSNFISYAKSNNYEYADVLSSQIQTAVLQVNLHFLNNCQMFIGLGPFGKSTYCEIGYVCARRDMMPTGHVRVYLVKPVTKELNNYDIMDKITDVVVYGDNKLYDNINDLYHPIRFFLRYAYPWNNDLLNMDKPMVFEFGFIQQMYDTAVNVLKNVYGLKLKHTNFEWNRVKPLTSVKTLRFFSGFWGEGKTSTINNHEFWKIFETERHYRKPIYMKNKNGFKIKIPTLLSIFKYYDILNVINDVDLHWYYYIWSILNSIITLIREKDYTTNIVYDRFVVDHMAFAVKYHKQAADVTRDKINIFLSLLKTIFPRAQIQCVLMKKFNIIPFNSEDRMHEYEAYGNKTIEHLNAERNEFYNLLQSIYTLLPEKHVCLSVAEIKENSVTIIDKLANHKKLPAYYVNELKSFINF